MINKIDILSGEEASRAAVSVNITFSYSDEELAVTTRNDKDDDIDFLKRLLLRDIFKIDYKKEDAE